MDLKPIAAKRQLGTSMQSRLIFNRTVSKSRVISVGMVACILVC